MAAVCATWLRWLSSTARATAPACNCLSITPSCWRCAASTSIVARNWARSDASRMAAVTTLAVSASWAASTWKRW